jgi:hypothetical protein
MDLKNNPHYQNGVFKGHQIVKNIENTVYGDLDAALESKTRLVKDLKEQFGWGESHKDVAENLGMIAAIETEIAKSNAIKPMDVPTVEYVKEVAEGMGLNLSETHLEQVIERYTEEINLEDLINDINNEKL